MAKLIIAENESYLGKEIAEESQARIDNKTKEGGSKDGTKESKPRRKRVTKQSK